MVGAWSRIRRFSRIFTACVAGLISLLSANATYASGSDSLSVGKNKQLFIDDFVVDSRESLLRVIHHPERYPQNPILTGTQPWEKWLLEVNGRPVLYDEDAKQFRMYYGANLDDANAANGTRYKVCYAVSKDGIHWTRVPLGQVEWEGSRANNILQWGENWMRRPNVIFDPADPDVNRRFKMTYVDVIAGHSFIAKGYSHDGIHWRLNGDGKPIPGGANSNLLGWDPHIGRYVLYPRVAGPPTTPGTTRSDAVGRSTSVDFISWSEPQRVLAAGPADSNRDFKGLAAFLYSDVYLGMLWVFEGDKSAQAELAFSRDGSEWQRVSPGEIFFRQGEPGSWDSNGILAVAPVIHGDRIYFYYAGWNVPYTDSKFVKQPDGRVIAIDEELARVQAGWVENGKRMQWAIGMATLRLDGFISLHAGKRPGVLTTKSFEATGGKLLLNADVRGDLRTEVLGENAEPLPGYAADDSYPIRSNEIQVKVRWKHGRTVEKLRGKRIRLRFIMREGDLYSFRFD